MRRKAGFVPASEKLTDPRSQSEKSEAKKNLEKIVKKRRKQSLEEAGLAPTMVGKIYRKGLKLGSEIGSRIGAAKFAIQKYKKEKAQQSADDAASLRAAGAPPSETKTSNSSSKSVLSRAIGTGKKIVDHPLAGRLAAMGSELEIGRAHV